MLVVDYSTDIPAAASYVTFVDDETSNFGLARGRRAMFVVPCASDAEAQLARALAEGLARVWGVRSRNDRPQADDSLRHFVIELEQLGRLRSGEAPPELSEDALCVIDELYADEDVFHQAAASILDDPSGKGILVVLPASARLTERDFAVIVDHVAIVAEGVDPTVLLPFRRAPRTQVA